MTISIFQMAGCLYTGVGALDKIPEEIHKHSLKKPLIVTDRGIINAGLCAKIEEVLSKNNIKFAVFQDTIPNPTDNNVMDCHKLYVHEKCDSIIALGGGSSMDCAKGCGILTHGKEPINYYEGINKMQGEMPFYFAVPTTAGTGSESTLFAVITTTKEEHPRKMVLYDARMLPHIAIIDPQLMTGLPPHITASTGCDALTHAIECFLSLGANEYTNALATYSIQLIARYLRRAVGNGNDMEAREKMAYAQTLAGIAFSNGGVGSVHALAHPLSSFFNISHGDANSLMLPYVMNFNKITTLDKMREIARLFGEDTTGLSDIVAADIAVEAIQRLTADVGIPSTITKLAVSRKLSVNKKDIPLMAQDAMKDVCTSFNPRVPTIDDYIALYTEAWG